MEVRLEALPAPSARELAWRAFRASIEPEIAAKRTVPDELERGTLLNRHEHGWRLEKTKACSSLERENMERAGLGLPPRASARNGRRGPGR